MLPGLALNLTSLVVAPGNGSGKVTIGRHHDKCDISLRGTCDHVLDEVTMSWGINNGVMPLLSEELLCGACDCHTTLALLLLAIHVEGEGEGSFAKALSLLLELLKLTLRDTTQLKEQAACGCALSTIDMTADDNGEMLFLGIRWHVHEHTCVRTEDQNRYKVATNP